MKDRTDELIELRRAQFDEYCSFLVEYNEKVNLTAITNRDEIFIKHFRDSILGEEFIPDNATMLDVGAGAGFPSLPIKIVRPDVKLTMCDSLNKRVVFLDELISRLMLKDVCTIHARAEELKKRDYYDVVIARAVAPLRILAEYCLPFVKIGGSFIAYKADDCLSEVAEAENAIKILGGEKAVVEKRNLDENTSRSFVIIKKTAKTPAKYPRAKNLPRVKPL